MPFVIFWLVLMGLISAGLAAFGVYDALRTSDDDSIIAALVAAVLAGLVTTTPFLVAGAVVTMLSDIRDSLRGDDR